MADDPEIEKVKLELPSQFKVGAYFDGQRASGGATYDRSWKNGFGLTAYAKAYWHDAPVIPTDRFGYVVGVEVTKKF